MDITKKAIVGGYIGQKEYRQNRVNTGAFEAKQTRIAEIVGHRDTINLKAGESRNPLGASDDVETFIQRQVKAKEQAYRSKLNRAERERLIAAIKARQSILKIGDTQQMGTNREEQVIVAQQTRNEAKVITQNIPAEIAVGPFRALVARILGKLPEKAYKYLSATVILSMALSACSAINRSKEFETGQAESPAVTAVMPDSVSDDEAAIEVTSSVAATETAQPINLVEDLLSRYLAGEIIDVNTLTQEEFIEFSAKLAEKKNASRGVDPIIFNNEYIDPSDHKLKDYDGHPDMNETIQMYVPIAGKDENGNLQFMVNGQLVTVAGSADVDWNMVISDPNDTRIDWPNTEPKKSSGLPEAQNAVDRFGISLKPMVILGKQLGEFHLDGIGNHASEETSTLLFYDIKTDSVGNPILARKILTIGLNYNLFEEGGTLDTQSFTGPIEENSYFYQGLVENSVYYVGPYPDVTNGLTTIGLSVADYKGAIIDDRAPKIILGQAENDQDMVIALITILIKKAIK